MSANQTSYIDITVEMPDNRCPSPPQHYDITNTANISVTSNANGYKEFLPIYPSGSSIYLDLAEESDE